MISVPANQNATLTRIPSRQILASQTVMPCQPNCEVHRLNLELQIIKTDKIQTLTEMLQITQDLGRTNRNRRNEIPRIERKLRINIEALERIEIEISRGCPVCRQL